MKIENKKSNKSITNSKIKRTIMKYNFTIISSAGRFSIIAGSFSEACNIFRSFSEATVTGSIRRRRWTLIINSTACIMKTWGIFLRRREFFIGSTTALQQSQEDKLGKVLESSAWVLWSARWKRKVMNLKLQEHQSTTDSMKIVLSVFIDWLKKKLNLIYLENKMTNKQIIQSNLENLRHEAKTQYDADLLIQTQILIESMSSLINQMLGSMSVLNQENYNFYQEQFEKIGG